MKTSIRTYIDLYRLLIEVFINICSQSVIHPNVPPIDYSVVQPCLPYFLSSLGCPISMDSAELHYVENFRLLVFVCFNIYFIIII